MPPRRQLLNDVTAQLGVVLPVILGTTFLTARFTRLSLSVSVTMFGVLGTVTIAVLQLNRPDPVGPEALETTMERLLDESRREVGQQELSVLSVAADEHRQAVIDTLRDADGEVPMTTLVPAVASRLQNVPEEAVTDEMILETHSELFALHLDRLDEAGFITHTPDRGTVWLTPEGKMLANYVLDQSSDVVPDASEPEDDSELPEVDVDTVFDVLKNARRRTLLSTLQRESQPKELQQVAVHVAAAEQGVHPADVDDDARRRAYVSLYQSHVPKLIDAGVLEYGDEDETTVRTTTLGDGILAFSTDLTTAMGEDDFQADVQFDLLANSRRRSVVRYLAAVESATTVDELATTVGAAEQGTTTTELSTEQRKRIYVSLYQVHLPKLADSDVIEYDPDTGSVRATDRVPTLHEVVQRLEDHFEYDPSPLPGSHNP